MEQVSLSDAHAIIERSRDGMELDITRPIALDRVSLASSIEQYTAPTLQAGLQAGPPRPPPPDEEDEYSKMDLYAVLVYLLLLPASVQTLLILVGRSV